MKRSKLVELVREIIREESEYQKFFRSVLSKFNIKSPNDLSDAERRKFFNYIDKNWKSVEESNKRTNRLPDYNAGDLVRVKSINKSGMVLKQYGRKVQIKFPSGQGEFDVSDIESNKRF